MKLNSAFFYTTFTFISLQLAMSSNVLAENIETPERWFEIEVILFNQLDNKYLKEKFPEEVSSSNLPNYTQSFDLLTTYIQPDLSNIKQLLPLCDDKKLKNKQLNIFPNTNSLLNEELNGLEDLSQLNLTQMRKDLNSFDFELDNKHLATETFSTEKLCYISQKEMAKLFNKQQLANINLNTLGINSLPTELNALGEHNPNSPYLISDNSLLLKDINKRLRWSQEFKPLLHFGWRQVGITKKDAIPLKLIAGKHIEYEYQNALVNYQNSIKNTKTLKTNSIALLSNNDEDFSNSNSLENKEPFLLNDHNLQAQRTQKALNSLFLKTEILNENTIDDITVNKTISEISNHRIDSSVTKNLAPIITDDTVNFPEEIKRSPIRPLQPWFLDGYLKVHLDHYLYITADFNILNQNDYENTLEKNKMKKNKLINFSQDRRVITGEIHYFDHPYIGMIIQIRRFDPNKPEGEQVSQSIK